MNDSQSHLIVLFIIRCMFIINYLFLIRDVVLTQLGNIYIPTLIVVYMISIIDLIRITYHYKSNVNIEFLILFWLEIYLMWFSYQYKEGFILAFVASSYNYIYQKIDNEYNMIITKK